MTSFTIYNMNADEDLGTYTASSPREALDVMARSYGFADYAACIADYGVDVEDAMTELKITQNPL